MELIRSIIRIIPKRDLTIKKTAFNSTKRFMVTGDVRLYVGTVHTADLQQNLRLPAVGHQYRFVYGLCVDGTKHRAYIYLLFMVVLSENIYSLVRASSSMASSGICFLPVSLRRHVHRRKYRSTGC